jgi:beta-galactosidase
MVAHAQQTTNSAQPEVLYGTAYYNEYMPTDRLDKDVALMKAAHLSVVRMGESTWSLWEPEDGRFEFAWMDRVVAAMGKAGIKVILGTPTYSIPAWMYAEHPEILVRPLGSTTPLTYGGRQNMDFDNPAFRHYAERMIRKLVSHYKDNPNVIGWQIDNETASYDAANDDVFQGFVTYLKAKYGTVENLNRAWFLNYWGQDIDKWADMPTPDKATSTSYKLEWSRWEQIRVTRYLAWQAQIVREERRPDQFVTQDFANAMHYDVNEYEIAKLLDVVSVNSYHATQDGMDGAEDTFAGDFARSLKHANYFVTETNAQTTDWSSAFQFPPYDGQLRLNAYTDLATGANMVEYWHWASIPAGQETYWKGILSHDLEPDRAYAEVAHIGRELRENGRDLVDLKVHNDVAILYSVDSANALHFMPFTHSASQWQPGTELATYFDLVHQMHRTLYNLNVGVDFLFPEDPDFSRYKLVIVPALYIADDALLKKLCDYVHAGGHVVMTFKSGFANENSAVRWEMAPGPLRAAAGFHYQEFSNLKQPLTLHGDPFHAGKDNRVNYWAEFLILEHAKALAYYEHPFFGRWPAITRNQFGAGTLTYEGTWLSDGLQRALLLDELKRLDLNGNDQIQPQPVRVRSGINSQGHVLHYYLNFSSKSVVAHYEHGGGTNVFTHTAVTAGMPIQLRPWGVAIIKEKATQVW